MTKEKTPAPEAVPETSAQNEPASAGVRNRRAFMMKNFVPSQDFINKEIVSKGKGTKIMLGRIVGVCTGTDDKTNTLPDGKQSTSVVLKGVFEAESYLDGEISNATAIYVSAAYAEQVKAMLSQDGVQALEVDIDVGLEATGKTIPYEWVVVSWRKGEEMPALKRLKASRGRPDNAAKLAAPSAVKQIAAQ